MTRLVVLVGLEVQGFETPVMDVLDFGERVLDELGGDGCGDAGEEEEHGFEHVVGADNGAVVVVFLEVGDGFLEEGVARPTSVVAAHELEVSLALHCFKGAEEDCGAESIFHERERPAGEDALDADGA